PPSGARRWSAGLGWRSRRSRSCEAEGAGAAPSVGALLRVLAGRLRGRAFLALVLAGQARLAAPGALEVVADADVQPAEALALQLDGVAVLEAAEPAMVGAGGEDVAGLQRVDRRHPLDAARDLVGHVVGVEVLLQLSVHPELDLELVHVLDLVGR